MAQNSVRCRDTTLSNIPVSQRAGTYRIYRVT